MLDLREKEIGTANRENTFHLLSSLAVFPLTERLGMSITDVQLLVAQARREALDPAFKAYFPVYVHDLARMEPSLTARRNSYVCLGQKRE